jgi:hypothetical protein
MGIKSQEFDLVRKRIEKTIELAEEERKRKLAVLRLEHARTGIAAMKKRKYGDAVRAFQSYLKTLEDLKGVPEGGLSPAVFDTKKDQQELLMISGVYWDLVKLFDRTRSAQKRAEFLRYVEKYLLFSKGMPFQPLCAESLRKYISSDKAIHRSEFSNAYRILSISRCFIATELVDVIDVETLPTLRGWRDDVLLHSWGGRRFVSWYYRNGPVIAEWVARRPSWARRGLGFVLDQVSFLIRVGGIRLV